MRSDRADSPALIQNLSILKRCQESVDMPSALTQTSRSSRLPMQYEGNLPLIFRQVLPTPEKDSENFALYSGSK